MIEMHSIRLEGCAHHVDTTFQFGNAPLTSVIGLNKDRKPHSSNGAGKSAMFYALCTVLQDHPLAVSRAKLKTGTITVEFTNEHRYKIIYDGGYKIYRDGKDLAVRTKSHAKEMVREIFPLTPAMFYSTFYINSLLFSPFLNGTDANRLVAFEEIFPLEQYADLQKPMLAKVRELKKKKVRFETLNDRIKEVEVVPDRSADVEKLRKYRKQYERLQKLCAETTFQQQNYDRLTSSAKALVPLSKADYTAALDAYSAYATAVKSYKADAAAYRKFKAYKPDPM